MCLKNTCLIFLLLLFFLLPVYLQAEETIPQQCDRLENEILFLNGVLITLNEDSMHREELYQVLQEQLKSLRDSDKKDSKRYRDLEKNSESERLFIEKQKKDIETLKSQKAEVEKQLSAAKKASEERSTLFDQYVIEQKTKLIKTGIISAGIGVSVGVIVGILLDRYLGGNP